MDYLLDRTLRVTKEAENKSLYRWFIGEFGADGQQVGYAQIPWSWTQTFTATEVVLSDRTMIAARDGGATSEVSHTKVIRARLRPGDTWSDRDWYKKTQFKMFGTDRVIEEFTLHIMPVAGADQTEGCTAWGIPSYVGEIDFFKKQYNDIVGFYYTVSTEAFARYAARIADGTADELVLEVKGVDGFYAPWSPSIYTSEIRVLTSESSHPLDIPEDCTFSPRRLGRVYEAQLSINAKRVQPKLSHDSEKETALQDDVEDEAFQLEPPARIAEASHQRLDPQAMRLLQSTRKAAWVGVTAVVIIALWTIF